MEKDDNTSSKDSTRYSRYRKQIDELLSMRMKPGEIQAIIPVSSNKIRKRAMKLGIDINIQRNKEYYMNRDNKKIIEFLENYIKLGTSQGRDVSRIILLLDRIKSDSVKLTSSGETRKEIYIRRKQLIDLNDENSRTVPVNNIQRSSSSEEYER